MATPTAKPRDRRQDNLWAALVDANGRDVSRLKTAFVKLLSAGLISLRLRPQRRTRIRRSRPRP